MKFLSNYLEFLLEDVTKQEMRIYYSDEFRDILKNMSKSSIAKTLLSSENSDKVIDIYTLIDITEKNDTISLIQVNRIAKNSQDLKQILPDNIIDKKNQSEFWNKARTEVKIGKWVRRIFSDVLSMELPAAQIEEFVNVYKSIIDGDSGFELVEGEKIREYYLASSYETTKGELGNSCMRKGSCQPYLDIFVKNTDVCKLLILRSKIDNNKIIGRALIWKLENSKYYMDRVYTANNSDQILYKNWADEKKMTTYFTNSDYLSVQLGDFEYETYPYMDTFLAYSRKEKKLSSNEDLWPDKGYIKIQETDGGFRSDEVVWSKHLNEHVPNDEARWCSDIEDYIYDEDALYLEYKSIYVARTGNVIYSFRDGGYFYKEDLVWSEVMRMFLRKDTHNLIKIIQNEDGDKDWGLLDEKEYFIEHNGEYYNKIESVIDPYTNKIVWKTSDSAEDLFDKLLKDLAREDNLIDYNTLSFQDLGVNSENNKRILVVSDAIDLYIKNKEEIIKKFERDIKKEYLISEKNDIDRLLRRFKIEDIPIMMLALVAYNSNNINRWWSDARNLIGKFTSSDLSGMDWSLLHVIIEINSNLDWSLFGEGISKRITLFKLVNNYRPS